jgi:hypothetical protein
MQKLAGCLMSGYVYQLRMWRFLRLSGRLEDEPKYYFRKLFALGGRIPVGPITDRSDIVLADDSQIAYPRHTENQPRQRA